MRHRCKDQKKSNQRFFHTFVDLSSVEWVKLDHFLVIP